MNRPEYLMLACCLLAVCVGLPADAGKAYVCKECGDPIAGDMFATGGFHYHARHFRCDQCRRPIKGDYTVYQDKNYHNVCFKAHVARRCALCEGVIDGEYIIDFWGNDYHTTHRGSAKSCEYCHRFISTKLTGGGKRFDDGRILCNICCGTAVNERADAQGLMNDIARRLGRFGMQVDLSAVRLHLVDRDRLQRVADRHSESLRGFTDYREDKNVFGKVIKRDIDVYLLHSMPKTEAQATLAHELAHVWQFSRGRLKSDRAWCEGSCNYASYLVLQSFDDEESRFAMQNLMDDPDPVYGEGFRRVKRLAGEKGDAAWVALLGTRDQFPAGF